MGTLIAFRHPTNLFARLADHTYVACGTLKRAWSCWGGKTNGVALGSGTGSTSRADMIAESNGRAGITCYLINGVCHQAANRILLPAGLLVEGARGYPVSEALYGTYGRPRGALGLCHAPFKQHNNVTGDLPDCTTSIANDGQGGENAVSNLGQKTYIEQTLRLYEHNDAVSPDASIESIVAFQMELFELFLAYRLGGDNRETSAEHNDLMRLRERVEHLRIELEDRFERDENVEAFVRDYNLLTIDFQKGVETILGQSRYTILLGLEPGDYVILADPEIVKYAYPREPGMEAT